MTAPHHTDYLIGDLNPDVIAANYQCGHCLSETALITDPDTGGPRLEIRHDDGCPVLTGVLSAFPDALRAASVPATFRP